MTISSLVGMDSSTYKLIREGIDASRVRAEAISNNMANINTRNYKRFNVVFEENLKNTSDKSIELITTKNRHITDGNINGNITVERDRTTSMRTDGNNVALEVEKVNQAANQLKYNGLITSVNNKISSLRYVITGGGV